MRQKIIAAQVTSRKYNIITKVSGKGENPQPHNCPENYQGSSKAMEADEALEILKRIYQENNGRVAIGSIVTDNDSTMKALYKHKTTHHKKENYRKKTLSRPG